MFGLLNKAINLTVDVTKIALAPVSITIDAAGAITRPVAQVAEAVSKEVTSLVSSPNR